MVLLYRFYRIFVCHVNLLIILDLYWVARKKTSQTFAWRYACNRVGEVNQQKSMYVTSKHLRS